MSAPRLLDAGDAAFTVEFGRTRSPEIAARVMALDEAVAQARAAGALPGLVEAMPTFRSLTLLYDPLQTRRSRLEPVVLELIDRLDRAAAADAAGARRAASTGRRWRLPVCYEGEFAPDLADVAAATGLAPDAVVQHHLDTEFRVYMVGFMPGFGFLGDLPEALAVPRLARPRLQVPAGSVAITGTMSAVYPWRSPGGWRLIGRCPVRLFDPAAAQPSLLAAGDRVRFEAIDAARLAEIQAAVAAGEWPVMSFSEPPLEPVGVQVAPTGLGPR